MTEGIKMAEGYLSSIEEVIDEARNGRMFILVDDEDRENEGDLIIPAQMATPDAVNFMARFGRGLICLTMTANRLSALDLPMMSMDNQSRNQTAFTVSIEAKEGVTTGISAADRAHTIAVAIDPSKGKEDLASPGHVFPLKAEDGGVLVRAGHTEASVDISRLAGLNPSAVICEIMNDDGTMARLPDLVAFAQLHGLKVATIRDLIAYRLKNDNLLTVATTSSFERNSGKSWNVKIYHSTVDNSECMALVFGKPDGNKPVAVRMHVLNPFEDILGEMNARAGQLSRAMDIIEGEGCGVVVLFKGAFGRSFEEAVALHKGERKNDKDFAIRNIGYGAQIMLDMGIKDMILVTNTKAPVIGLEGYGLSIVEHRQIPDA